MNVNTIKAVHLITKLELGGAQLNTLYTCKNIQSDEIHVMLWSGPGGILTEKAAQQTNLVLVSALQRKLNLLKDLAALWIIFKMLRKHRPDILHTHSSKAGALGRIAAKMAGIPIVIHSVHGYAFSPLQKKLKIALFRSIEKILVPLTTHYIFVAQADMKVSGSLGIDRSKCSLIRSGFPLNKFFPCPALKNRVRRKYRIKPDDVVIGTIAPFKPQKGLFDLIEIARLVLEQRTAVFFIAGDGNLRNQIEQRLEQLNIRQHFRLPGFIENMPDTIEAFDIGLTTALWEGLPQSLVQLRLKEKPVVASSIPGNSEVIFHNKNGFLANPGDCAAFAEQLIKLIDFPDLRKILGAYNDSFAEWEGKHMVASQKDLYLSLWKNCGS